METLNVVGLPGPSPSCSTHLPAVLMTGNTGRSLGKTKAELSLVSSQRVQWFCFHFFLLISHAGVKYRCCWSPNICESGKQYVAKLPQTQEHAKTLNTNSNYQVHTHEKVSLISLLTSKYFNSSKDLL